MTGWASTWGVVAWGFLCVVPAYSQTIPDKSGTRPTVLSLPAGPGSIAGLGKSFQPQLNSGAVSYAIPLTVPAGPAGFGPTLTLVYNTGFGNGPLGRGWHFAGPLAIERRTAKGFPRYRDTDGEGAVRDVFVFEGEELVPLSNGTYRLENDESFRRFSAVASRAGGPVDAWLVEDRDGTRRWLGRHGGGDDALVSRVLNPTVGDRTPFERTFRWLEDAAEDVNGNRIEYEYRTFADSPGVLYLARVTWRARESSTAYHLVEMRTETRPDQLSDYRSGFERRWARRYCEVSLGSHFDGMAHRIRAYELSFDPRDGVLFHVEAGGIGLGVSTLHAVTQFGADRGWGGLGDRGTPLPPVRFSYTPMRLQSYGPGAQDRLAALRDRMGTHEPDPLTAGAVIRHVRQESSDGSTSPFFDAPVHDPRVEFADIDGDGLADLLDTRVDSRHPTYTVARNLGNDRFRRSRPMRHPPGVDLGRSATDMQTVLSDADGNGLIDVMQIAGRNPNRRTVIYRNVTDETPEDAPGFDSTRVVAYSTPPRVDLTHADVRQIDLDFDKIPDVLVTLARRLIAYVAAPDGTWKFRAVTARPMPEYRFSMGLPGGRRARHPLVQLADMNGDRLLDLVRVRVQAPGSAEIRYRPMTGPATWGTEVTLDTADRNGVRGGGSAHLQLPGIRADPLDRDNRWDAVRILDANGDGLSDLVFMEPGFKVRLYFNVHGTAMSGPYESDAPRYRPTDTANPTLLRTADMNGNGSMDLVFFHRSGGPDVQGIRYLDFMGGQKPGLLLVADNGIGLRSYVRYKPAVVDQIAARKSGAPWARVSPVPMWVVSGIANDIGVDLNLDADSDRRVTTFRYRDPYYDGFEKQFRGFRFVQQIEWGDDVDPETGLPLLEPPVAAHRTTVTRFGFHTGAPDRVDNDDYLDSFDTETRAAARVVDERTAFGGREEEALKGKALFRESVHPLALLDASANFDVCALALVRDSRRPTAGARCTPDRYVYRREESRWTIRRLYRPPGVVAPKGRLLQDEPAVTALRGMTVSFPHRIDVLTTVPEANGVLHDTVHHPYAAVVEADPVTLKVEFEYDDFGNLVVERNWGIVSGRDPPVDDERVVRSTFARSRTPDGRIDPWILDREVTRRVEDEHGAFASETRNYYDGPAFVGLALGQLGRRGLVSRTERRVSDRSMEIPPLSWVPVRVGDSLPGPGDPRPGAPEWVVQERAAHDRFGNTIARTDGLARFGTDYLPDPEHGHVTVTTFDPVFHTLPIEERLQIGDGKSDLVFRAAYLGGETDHSAAVHWGHGVVRAFWDANGNRTDYLHDRHARLTGIRSPGDSEALPSVLYTYRPADPHRGLTYEYDRSGRLQPNGSAVPVSPDGAANLVITDRRETAGAEGVFRRATFSTGDGAEVLRLEEDGSDGYAVVYAARVGMRGTPIFEAQPYRQPTFDFRVPGTEVYGTDLSRDAMGRVTRRRLPPEVEDPRTLRLETRVHYQPLSEWRFDEEDLAAATLAQDHRGTPFVLRSDGLERLIGVTEQVKRGSRISAWSTRYFHDLNDKLVGILDSQSNLRVTRHDGLGRRIAAHDTNRGLTRFVFDAADNVTETRDAKGQRITYRYDGANRLISEDYQDLGQPFSSGRDHDTRHPVSEGNRPDIVFSYDEPVGPIRLGDGRLLLPSNTRGFLTGVSDLSGEEHVSYDARGRVAWEVKSVGLEDAAPRYLTVMAYDSSDRLTAVDYPDGTRVSYHYDARGRTRRIDSPHLGVIVAGMTYTAAGERAGITFGNGVRTSITRDPRLRPRTISALSPGDRPPFMDYRYRYDGASNLLAIEDWRPTAVSERRFHNSQQFTYDDLYRLTGAAYDTGDLALAYDRIGNLTERRFVPRFGGQTVLPAPGRVRHGGLAGSNYRIGRSANAPGPQAPSSDERGQTYDYDANGNLLQAGDMILTWDFNDRLVAVESPGVRAEYVYDYAGRRVIKRVRNEASPRRGAQAEIHYVSRYFEVVGGTAQRYVFDGETRLARAPQGGSPVFYHQDLVGSTDALTDISGALVQSNAFMPFGDIRARYGEPSVADAAPEYLFHRKERDPETGLLYFEARYLNADAGRFSRVDPAILGLPPGALETPQLLNGYAFAGNNPFRYSDGSGQWAHGVGVTVNVSGKGIQPSVSLHVVWDQAGNWGVLFTRQVAAVYSPLPWSVGVEFGFMMTGAETIHDLTGFGWVTKQTSTRPGWWGGGTEVLLGDRYGGAEFKVTFGTPDVSVGTGVLRSTLLYHKQSESEVNQFKSPEMDGFPRIDPSVLPFDTFDPSVGDGPTIRRAPPR